MYKLKPNVPDFEVVDGPFAGRKYKAGNVYQEVPKEEIAKFIPIEEGQNEITIIKSE